MRSFGALAQVARRTRDREQHLGQPLLVVDGPRELPPRAILIAPVCSETTIDDRVGLLAQTERRAVARSETAVRQRLLGQRQ